MKSSKSKGKGKRGSKDKGRVRGLGLIKERRRGDRMKKVGKKE